MRLTNKPRGKAKAGGKGQPERIVPEVLEKKRKEETGAWVHTNLTDGRRTIFGAINTDSERVSI